MLSISNNRYEPPCKSKPRLIFLFKKSLLNLKILEEANSKSLEVLKLEENIAYKKWLRAKQMVEFKKLLESEEE